MSVAPEASARPTARQEAVSFFRQGGWMVIATTGGGVFMMAVHFFNKSLPKAEYGVLLTLLQILNLMLIPAVGLQSVFAQQAAAALTEEKRRELTGAVRGVMLGTFAIWTLMLIVVAAAFGDIVRTLQIRNPMALLMTVACGLAMLWLPIVQGLLQGVQNFMWLGWSAIFNGVGRFVLIGIFVVLMGGHAAGAVTGAFLAMWLAVGIGVWHTRKILLGPHAPFAWGPWLRRVVPLTLGLGSTIFFMSADQLVVQSAFSDEQTPYYAAAGMFARGLVMFTSPLTAVMFPKIVHSAAKSEKTDVLWQALGATALLGAVGALVCTIAPEFPLRLVYKMPEYLPAKALLPLFVWCMFPLTLSTVLLSNLFARERFAIVPWLMVLVVGYMISLKLYHPSFEAVIKTIGVFNVLVLGVAIAFTTREARRHPSPGAR